MKKIFMQFPVISRFALAFFLGVLALIASGWLDSILQIRSWFPFTGIILMIIATSILYKTDNSSLKAIGLTITLKNILFLLLGLILSIIALGIANYLRTFYTGEQWHLSSYIDQAKLWKGLYFILPSVIIQELMFRGYLFTKTIEISNITTANVIFAILFTLVHVLDRDVMQQPMQAIALAVMIPVGHLLFATALLRSKTLFFPIGIHWGNNWASQHLAGYYNNDHSIFYTSNHKIISGWPSFIIMLLIFDGVFLLLIFIIWKWKKPANNNDQIYYP